MAIDDKSIITYMTVDLTAQNNFDYIRAIQGDNSSRYVYVEVLKNQEPYIKDEEDTKNIEAVIMGTKPNGGTIFNSCPFVVDSITGTWYVAVELTDAITQSPGKGDYSICFFSTVTSTDGLVQVVDNANLQSSIEETETYTSGKKLESFKFDIYVAKSAFDFSEMAASSEWALLTEQLANIGEIRTMHDEAVQSADNALISETNAKTSETNALASKNSAATSETNAATSETNASNSATLSKSWAVGNTNTRDGENTNNSKYYSEQSASYTSTNKSYMNTSKSYMDTTETYKNNASDSATLAESWAVGHTNTRTGEDTDNAKYYSDNAKGYADELSKKIIQGLFVFRGEYNSTTEYHYLDIITYAGSSFLVVGNNIVGKQPNKNVPQDDNYFLMAKGADGADIYQESEPTDQVAGAFWDEPY